MKLYLAGMPIGNDRDITLRVLDIAANCDFILCESKAVVQRVLKRAGLPLEDRVFIEVNEHNEASSESILAEIEEKTEYQANVMYASDAGMPVIEDPGSQLTTIARNRGWNIELLPGPSAISAALSFCAINAAFFFSGFPPREKKERKRFFESIAARKEVVIFYEVPYRIGSVIDGMLTAGLKKRYCRLVVDLTGSKQYFFEGRVEELKKEQIPKGPPVFILLPDKSNRNR